MGMTIVLKPSAHYAAHGLNSAIVVQTVYDDPKPSDFNARKVTTLQFRKGREQDGQAVQLEITVETVGKKRTVGTHASVSFDEGTWAAIVEHVKENRNIERDAKA